MKIIQNGQNEKIPKGKGFYITLSACFLAIFVAGWSVYKNFKETPAAPKIEKTKKNEKNENPLDGQKNISGKILSDEASLNKDVSGENENSKISGSSLEHYDEEDDDTLTEDSDYYEENTQSVLSENSENLIVYPTNNTVIKEFSDGKPVYSKTLGDWRVHDGVDFKADKGSLVKSITNGMVKDVYNDPSYGITIVIEHTPGFVAYYSGLGSTTLVKKGDQIKAGDDIGSINEVPIEIAEEPHLHLMINQDGKFIDPILILDKETE